ncbi:MAG: ATPase [Paludibacter sp.]
MSDTPFVYGKMADSHNFTDRVQETGYLTNNFKGLINTIIISPRRWGKTSLVNKVAAVVSTDKDYIICKIDIFNCRTADQFYTAYANAVLKASTTAWDEFVAGAKKYLSRMLPKIALTNATQMYELSFGVDFGNKDTSVDDILDLPQVIAIEKGKKVIVCIDEFQNINDYADSLGFQQKLRAHWQLHTHVSYCLYGSKRHMLMRIFTDYKMPFYKFGDLFFLEKIKREDWIGFISGRFAQTGKHISDELCSQIAGLMNNHPYYTQQLSQQVWLRTTDNCTLEIVTDSFQSLVNQLSLLFRNIIDSMTVRQINFLKSIAFGEVNFSSKSVLDKYQLGSSANIKNLRQATLDRDIIDILPGNKMIFQDPVFEYWLVNEYFVAK